MSNLVGAPVAVSLSPPTGLSVMILRSLAKNWSNYQLMRRCTCQQCQEHGKNGQCLGQRQDRAQDQSMLRKSPLALGNTYQCQSTKSSSTSLTSSSNGLHLELPLPATFAPSLSIHTPSPSRRLSLSSHQSPRQSWDCKIVKVNSRRGLGLTCAAGTRRGSRRCRSKAALHVFHLWGTNSIAINSMCRILSIS